VNPGDRFGVFARCDPDVRVDRSDGVHVRHDDGSAAAAPRYGVGRTTTGEADARVTVRLRNADGLSEPPGYAHVAIASGARMVFTAGGVPLDPAGTLVGPGDHAAQAEQVIANLIVALTAGGAAPPDVVKTTVYVVGPHEALIRTWDVVRASPVGRAPSTLLGVALLGYTGQLVEIEALAVVDGEIP
jgi:enamine deaminase RidA (YjgF/YER057c/UK114 family)